MKVLAVIPARGGSKSIPRKNLVDVAGRPLIAWAIAAAREAKKLDRVIVSTEDAETAETNETYLQRQDLPPAYVFDGAIFVRHRRLLEEWSGRDFGLGADVRALVLSAESSLHIDDPIHLEVARVVLGRRAR